MTAIVLLIVLFLLGVASLLGLTVDSRDTEHSVASRDTEHSVGALVDYAVRRRTRY